MGLAVYIQRLTCEERIGNFSFRNTIVIKCQLLRDWFTAIAFKVEMVEIDYEFLITWKDNINDYGECLLNSFFFSMRAVVINWSRKVTFNSFFPLNKFAVPAQVFEKKTTNKKTISGQVLGSNARGFRTTSYIRVMLLSLIINSTVLFQCFMF